MGISPISQITSKNETDLRKKEKETLMMSIGDNSRFFSSTTIAHLLLYLFLGLVSFFTLAPLSLPPSQIQHFTLFYTKTESQKELFTAHVWVVFLSLSLYLQLAGEVDSVIPTLMGICAAVKGR